MMRVLVLGGTGRFGQLIASLLAQHDLISHLVVGGRELNAAQKVTGEIGGKASAVQIDSLQEAELKRLLMDCDLLINATGPYEETLLPAVRAAIATKTSYCDLLEDGKGAEEVLALDREAQQAGITALIGIGLFPGLTNLLAKHAVVQLDEVRELRIYIVLTITQPSEQRLAEMRASDRISAAWRSMMIARAGRPRVYKDGRWVKLKAVPDSNKCEMPGGNSVRVAPIRFSEPVTLPRYLAGVSDVSTLFGLLPPQADVEMQAQARRIHDHHIAPEEAVLSFFEALAEEPQDDFAPPAGVSPLELWVEALGTLEGRPVQYACWPTGDWWSTQTILATAALQLLNGDIQAKGVIPPEAALEPLAFFDQVAKWGIGDLSAKGPLEQSHKWLE